MQHCYCWRNRGAPGPVPLEVDGQIYDATNINVFVENATKSLKPEESTTEKDLFAGFNAVHPPAGGGMQGVISFNGLKLTLATWVAAVNLCGDQSLDLRRSA